MQLKEQLRVKVDKDVKIPKDIGSKRGRIPVWHSTSTRNGGQFDHIKSMDVGDSVNFANEQQAMAFSTYASKKGWRTARQTSVRVWRTS